MTTQSEAINKMTIGGKEIPVNQLEIKQSYLKFYPENPRIYSIIYSGGDEPSQEEIQEKLSSMEHVNQLVQSIKANGGLIEPLVVRDGDYVVLEGNSRLAAYRILAKKDPIKWAKVKCTVLPSDISEDLIFTLLGQYHIISKKDWSPYEQAGYLWRRDKNYNITPEQMATEMGMSKRQIEFLIDVYDFMHKYGDADPQHWSYYVEYLKSKNIKRVRENIPEFDEIVAVKIRTNVIPAAIDIRNKLEPITRIKGSKGDKIVKKFVDGQASLDKCFELAQETGVTSTLYQRLSKFRTVVSNPDTKKELKQMTVEQKQKSKYELKKIKEAVDKLIAVVEE